MQINNHQIVDYDAVLDAKFGAEGTPERAEAEEKAYAFYTGQIIEDARKKAKITQAELARRIGSDRSYISRVESGQTEPKVSTFYRIMNALGCRIEFSLVKDDTPLNDPNSIELELLSNLVADYSEEHFSLGEPSLVDVLKLRMYEMGLNQKSLSQLIGVSPSRLSDYISGKCEPTLKVAREISKKLNIDASIVLGV